MNYWHLQMNQPWGRDSIVIDSKNMLQENPSIIGTGDWDDDQFRNFTDENGTGIKIDDIVLVREGATPIALCKVSGENFKDSALQGKYHNQNFRTVNVLSYYDDKAESILKKKLATYKTSYIQASGTLNICRNNNATCNFIHEWYKYTKVKKKMDKLKQLLRYKKQIILQGPPGTGKTRLAKEISRKLISISIEFLLQRIKVGMQIPTAKGQVKYKILSIDESKMILEREEETTNTITFSSIINAYETKKWNNTITNNDDRMAVAIAKYLYEEFFKENDQVKLIQFHPSYTYEDFVRGIVAESSGINIEYKNVNKTLGLFADKALKNYNDSKKEVSIISKEKWLESNFALFVEKIAEDLNIDKPFKLTDNVNIVDLEDDAFLYIGNTWKGYEHRMLFKDIKQAFLDDNSIRKDLSNNLNISGSARQHATYYVLVLKAFIEFIKDKPFKENSQDQVVEKPFILIIDEINRANISSVLGELIYALEYRGEEVESIYEVDGSQKLILPPNLYIIGTMNTADRSVGHIDYAIRRRFAFVDVLPKELHEDDEIYFNTNDFSKVSALFNESNVSKEFEIDAVQIGHSYFIVKKEDAVDTVKRDALFKMKMDYEVKPILLEYERDGILIGEYDKKPIREFIKSL